MEKQRWEESEKRRAEEKREDQRRERVRRKKMQVPEKVGKSQNTVFFQWFVAPEGRKVGLLKRRVRSHVVRWEMKSCTPFWREAHFQVKMCKTLQPRSTFGSWDVEKVHAVVHLEVKMYKTPGSEHFWKLRCRKSARGCGAKHISKSKCTTHTSFGALLEVEMSKKCTLLCLWKSKCAKHQGRSTFGSWDVEKVHALWREAHFQVKMLKAPHARTSFEGSDVLLCGRRTDRELCTALHSILCFLRTSRRLVSFLILSTSKNEEVSQNSFVFDVVKFKNWRCLTELLRFWCCPAKN